MKKLVFLTGAGISVDSGLSTFRDSNGLWEQYPVEEVASIQGYRRNPSLVIDFYNQRRRQLIGAVPNPGHLMVASLEQYFDTTVVTQNVDDLHERAGSTNIIHLHGELMKATSSNYPNDTRCIETLTSDNLDIHIGDKAKDGSQLRPFIVWFGEDVPMMEKAAEITSEADIFVVVGSSLNVYPAAGLLGYVSPQAQIYLIDPNPVNVPYGIKVHTIQKGASEGMKDLKDLLLAQR